MLKKMIEFYHTNDDFRDFIDANAKTYNKEPCFMITTPTAYEYYISLQKGGCNERHKKEGNNG